MTTETFPATTPVHEPTTPIRPSVAIRLGCLTTEQAFGEFGGDGQTTACVVIAAAIGGFHGSWSLLLANRHCPVTLCFRKASVVHLNDDHRWSRERIASWLAEQGL
jgi:hypothetical protein